MIPSDVVIPRNLDLEAEWAKLLSDVAVASALPGFGFGAEEARQRLAHRLARLESALAELWRAHPKLQDRLLGEVDR